MLVSVFIPVYNEEENLSTIFAKLSETLGSIPGGDSYELLFIDDGSKDNSYRLLLELAEQSHRFPVRIIKLARNAGTHVAFLVAARYCQGDAAVYIAADLQCPTEVIPELVAKHRESFEIVWALRAERKDPLLTRFFASIYYSLMRLLVRDEMRFHNVETFLVGRKVLDHLKLTWEKNSNLLMLIAGLGFKQGSVTVKRGQRVAGRSSWSFAKRAKLLIDSLISFTYLPIRLISIFGILVSLAGFGLAGFEIYEKLAGSQKPQGWTSLVVLILLLSGIQMLMLGFLGEYLWRIMDQISTRPMFVIDSLVGFEEDENLKKNHEVRPERKADA